jgi:hypothetical protein
MMYQPFRPAHMSANRRGNGGLCGLCRRHWLGGNARENDGSGVLDGFQTLSQQFSISAPNLDVILGCRSGLETNSLTNYKGHGFGLADLGGQHPAFASMQHLVADFMNQRGELLSGLHTGKQRDLPAVRRSLRWCNPVGEGQFDALRLHESEEPLAVYAHVTWISVSVGLRLLLDDIERIHGAKANELLLAFLLRIGTDIGCGFFLPQPAVADHRSQNENALLATFDEAAKRIPGANPGNVAGIRFLSSNQHDVAKAVGMESKP